MASAATPMASSNLPPRVNMEEPSNNINSPTPAPVSVPYVAPDGGWKAWSTVAGGFFCQFASFGFINALGTFQYIYETNILKTTSPASITWILTMQLFLMFFFSQPVGLLVDLFGHRIILAVSSLLSVAGLIGLAFARSYGQVFLAQSICFGLGAAGVFTVGMVVAAQWFSKKRVIALGVVAAGSSLGGVIFPIFLAQLYAQIGFEKTILYTALIIGIALLLANVLMFPAMKPKGLAGRRTLIRFSLFKQTPYLLFVIGVFLYFWGLFAPFDFLPLFADQDASTKGVSLYMVSILNAASLPGRILPSLFSGKIGHLKVLAFSGVLTAISVLVIWVPLNSHPSLGGLVFLALMVGFFSGAFVGLMTPCLLDVAGGHSSDFGAMMGTFFAIIAVSSLTGLPIQASISKGNDLLGLMIFAGIAMLLGSILLVITDVMIQRRKVAVEEAKASH
ncbi:MFS general substrate transporter [Microthyrium microscopicum]|uniref:MFS general substrate transporter n=1 Tax=Microthyrium microscopicum TaxID=703497 RepID=A0A6A6UDY8_9PEZI|nr:MFS general substrate transporter [Microthyrium microscopicum]